MLKSKKNITSTLLNRQGAYCAFYATIQQLVVAASTYFIIEAIQFTTNKDNSSALLYTVLFVASLIVVYLPNMLSILFLQKWRLASFGKFVELFTKENYGRTTLAHQRHKIKYESWLTNESSNVYTESTDLLYQAYSTFLSALFNISVIAFAIDGRISLWYLFAGAVLFASSWAFQSKIAKSSLNLQESRKALANTMLTSWENIFVGNRYNLLKWKNGFSQRLSSASESAVKYDLTRSLISSITVSVALIIIAIGNAIFLFENQSNVAALATLMITLPRQVQIVQFIFSFFNTYLSWKGVSYRLAELESVVRLADSAESPEKYVKYEKIKVSQHGKENALKEDLLNEKSGRFTLRGENGAGKSTFLSLLSERTADKSFFLPSNYADLEFQKMQTVSGSDGQRISHVFDEIEEIDGIDLILLDEWDANLDQKNISILNEKIEKLAQDKLVIESRHRA